jgi:hypothetical protein
MLGWTRLHQTDLLPHFAEEVKLGRGLHRCRHEESDVKSPKTLSILALCGAIGLAPVSGVHATQVPNRRNVTGPVVVREVNAARFSHVLPTGRIVSPRGRIQGTPNFVTALLPWGPDVAVLNNGATRFQDLTLYAARSLEEVARLVAMKGPVADLKGTVAAIGHQSFFQGMALGVRGRRLFVAGGVSDDVLALVRQGGHVVVLRRYPLTWQPFQSRQYPYHYAGHHAGSARLFYPDAVAAGPHGRHLFASGLLANSLARINLRSGHVRYLNVGPYPYALAFADHGKRLVVSLWGSNRVAVVEPRRMGLAGTVRLGPPTGPGNTRAGIHPTALVAIRGTPNVLVALSNVDRVVRVNVRSLRETGELEDSPYPGAPPGSYPDALAVSKGRIFVANAGNNDIAVFSLGSGKPLGLIPTGWYPTSLAIRGGALYIASAKGLGSGPNVEHQWVGDMMGGLVQKVDLDELSRHGSGWTRDVLRDDGFTEAQRTERHRADGQIARWLRQRIRYVVFILRENKTFDEDFGDYGPAGRWADPHLDLFGPRELPNLYDLAHRGTLFVNFMADGEVTAQGHQWTTAASDSDFVQRTWPEYYSGRGLVANPGWTQSLIPGGATGTGGVPLGVDNPYAIYENLSALGAWSNPWISYPGRLFLFNDLLDHRVSFEDFGEFVSRSEAGNISPAMHRHLAMRVPGWDRMLLDTFREHRAVAWLKAHTGARFPHFIYIWLPDDHTAGRSPCYYTPDYYVANNDYATARFIHYLSTTPQWRHMVVFMTEDDAQSGADHINAHRTLALAVGPWVKRGHLETHLYSQVNLLKTVEAIFGLPPLSQWDQNARVFSGLWTRHPDFARTPVLPMRIRMAFNAGACSHYTLMRQEAGAHGHRLPPNWKAWYRSRQLPRTGSGNGSIPDPREAYSPTTLLKVPGPEQMKQEWVASKGVKSYAAVMAYLKHYAARRKAPVSAYEGGGGH